jgi:YVTN family beta-propeller protein
VRHVEVVPDVALPPLPPPPIAEPTPRTGPSALRLRRKWVLALLGSALALAGVLALLVVTRTGDENGAATPTPVVPDSVAVIDPQTNSVRADVPVGGDPGPVAVGGQAIWVGNQEDETVSRIDPASRTVVRTFGVGHPVNGLAFAEGSLWIASSREGVLHRFDPSSGSSLGTIRFRPPHALHGWNSGGLNTDRPVAMVFGEGGLWLGDRDSQTLLRIDAQSLRVTARIHDLDPKALALRAGSVWVISYLDQAVVRVDAETGVPSAPIPVPVNPNGIVAGARSIWVAHDREGTVSENRSSQCVSPEDVRPWGGGIPRRR